MACILTSPMPARGSRLIAREMAFAAGAVNKTATSRELETWDTGYPCNEQEGQAGQDAFCESKQGNYCQGHGVFCKRKSCYCGTRTVAPHHTTTVTTILAVSTGLYHATTVPVDTGFDISRRFKSRTHTWQSKDRNFPHGPSWFAFAEYNEMNPGPTQSAAGHSDSTGLTFAVAAVTQTNLLVGPNQKYLPDMVEASMQGSICDQHCRFSVFEYLPTKPLTMMVFKTAQDAKAFASQVSGSQVQNDQGTAFQLSTTPRYADYDGYIVEQDNKRSEREVVLFRPNAQLSFVCKHAADVRATFGRNDVMQAIVATIYDSDNPSLPWKRVVWDTASPTFGRTEDA